MTVDPLNSTAYVVTLAVLFGGGYAAFKGALWWQDYRNARREADRTARAIHDPARFAEQESGTSSLRAQWLIPFAVAVIGLALAVEVWMRTDALSGGMFAGGVLIVVALLRPAWAAGLFIAMGEMRAPLPQKGEVKIIQDPWALYPMLGSVAFLLLGIPVAEIVRPDASPIAPVARLLPYALLAWICLTLEPLVWRRAASGGGRSLKRRIFMHPLAVALVSAACVGGATAIVEWFSPPRETAVIAFAAYMGALFGVLGWESVVGGTVRSTPLAVQRMTDERELVGKTRGVR